jgi:hypothetical protein
MSNALAHHLSMVNQNSCTLTNAQPAIAEASRPAGSASVRCEFSRFSFGRRDSHDPTLL